jgi:hypothetical protein
MRGEEQRRLPIAADDTGLHNPPRRSFDARAMDTSGAAS